MSEHKRLPKIRGRTPGAGEGVCGGPDPDPYYLLPSCIRPRSHVRLSLESDPIMAGSAGPSMPGCGGFMPTSLDSSERRLRHVTILAVPNTQTHLLLFLLIQPATRLVHGLPMSSYLHGPCYLCKVECSGWPGSR